MRIQMILKRDHPGGSDLRMRGLWKHRASLDSHKEEVRDQKQEKHPKYYCWLDNGEAYVVRHVGSLHLQRPAMSWEAARKWGPQFYSPKKVSFVNNQWAWKRMLASDENLIPSWHLDFNHVRSWAKNPDYVHHSIFHNGQDVARSQMSLNRRRDNSVIYVHTVECYSAITKMEILSFVNMWMDLEGIMVRELSQ